MRLTTNERLMDAVTVTRARSTLMGIIAAASIAGIAVTAMSVSSTASLTETDLQAVGPGSFVSQEDPACGWLGWAHPACAGGAFDSVPDDGIPGDNAAEGGIPAPAMVPNVDGSMSPPGTPGAI